MPRRSAGILLFRRVPAGGGDAAAGGASAGGGAARRARRGAEGLARGGPADGVVRPADGVAGEDAGARAGDAVEVLLVHPGGPYWAKKDRGAWSIPKGEVEPGEDPRAGALRELEEETGVALDPAPDELLELGEIRNRSGKIVVAWAVEAEVPADAIVCRTTFELEWPPRSGRIRAFPEIDRAAWLPLDRARVKLLPAQRPFLDRLVRQLGR